MSTDLLIYLVAAVIAVPIAKRFGLGSILGYLVAGAIIGPVLHLVDHGGHESSVSAIAELGVVMMLFVIGLELEVKHLWAMRKKVFRGGTLQVVVCGAALMGGLMLLGVEWRGALVSGIALALSSTAIAMQTMKDRNIEKTTLGESTFAILLFQDMAAIPLLAVIPLLGVQEQASNGNSLGWLYALGAIAAVVVFGLFLSRPLLRLVASTGVREIFTAFALLLVLGVGELMHLAGLSMGLGAFLAGVLLASSEYKHALEADLDPFKGLLLGLFFIAIGMGIKLELFAEEPLTILGLLVAFVFAKLWTLRFVGHLLHVPMRQAWLLAALIGQGGEFGFVVFNLATDVKILDDHTNAVLTLVVALSMATTPLLLIWHDYLGRRHASKQKKEYDEIEDHGASVIIAGFGRFGQIVGRFLFANGVKATVLDDDAEQIEFLRRFGFRVFYGDATRTDLLEKAGAARAKVLVVAINEKDASLALVNHAKEHFPHLKILARARNIGHWTALRLAGIDIVERETFEGSLLMGRRVLEVMGTRPYEAREAADVFRRHNYKALEALLPMWDDEQKRIQFAKDARDELEEQMERDRAAVRARKIKGWHGDAAIEKQPEEVPGDELS